MQRVAVAAEPVDQPLVEARANVDDPVGVRPGIWCGLGWPLGGPPKPLSPRAK